MLEIEKWIENILAIYIRMKLYFKRGNYFCLSKTDYHIMHGVYLSECDICSEQQYNVWLTRNILKLSKASLMRTLWS